jgi:hypothetical protein
MPLVYPWYRQDLDGDRDAMQRSAIAPRLELCLSRGRLLQRLICCNGEEALQLRIECRYSIALVNSTTESSPARIAAPVAAIDA